MARVDSREEGGNPRESPSLLTTPRPLESLNPYLKERQLKNLVERQRIGVSREEGIGGGRISPGLWGSINW